MDTKAHIRIGLHMLKRLLQGLVIWPASALGIVAFIVGLLGGSPFHGTVAGLVHWADSSLRQAPAGMALVSECVEPQATKPEPILCKQTMKAYPIDDVIASTESNVYNVYWTLVLLSFAAMALTMGWREFFGLPQPDKPSAQRVAT